MATWNDAYNATPAGNTSPSLGDDHIRDVKEELDYRFNQEHVFHDTASTGETIHRQGSAVAYFQTAEPTTRPDGATGFGTGDSGRLRVDPNNSNALTVYDHTSTTFEDVTVSSLITTGDYEINGLTLNGTLDVAGDVTIGSSATVATGGEAAPDVDNGGLCLNHGANDNNVFTLKNSNVSHGMTAQDQSDTYMAMSKYVAGTGGLQINSYSEDHVGFKLNSYITNETILPANAAIRMNAAVKSGNDVDAFSAAASMVFCLSENDSPLIYVTANGSLFYDGALGNFDDEDDFALIENMGQVKQDSFVVSRGEKLGITNGRFHSVGGRIALNTGGIKKLITIVRSLVEERQILTDRIVELERKLEYI